MQRKQFFSTNIHKLYVYYYIYVFIARQHILLCVSVICIRIHIFIYVHRKRKRVAKTLVYYYNTVRATTIHHYYFIIIIRVHIITNLYIRKILITLYNARIYIINIILTTSRIIRARVLLLQIIF